MSTFAVKIEQLEIFPHPNADRLELAQVGNLRAVVERGRYTTGDFALYIPEAAVLPDNLISELNLEGKLAGSAKNRVKAVRLRGEISQGIVCRPSSIMWDDEAVEANKDRDFAEDLGIVKWVPPVPAQMAGQVEPAGRLIRWPDIENIKRFPDIFEEGEEVVLTEKIHGTCCLITYDVETNAFFVSSKGLGGRNLALKESDTNLYWRAVRKYNLQEIIYSMVEDATRQGVKIDSIGLFGEVYGSGVQDLTYGVAQNDGPGYAAFDCYLRMGAEEGFVNATQLPYLLAQFKVPIVPTVYQGPWDLELAMKLAEVQEEVSGKESNIREGLVIRPIQEGISEITGSRKIAKLISEQYLLRKGDTTEYE